MVTLNNLIPKLQRYKAKAAGYPNDIRRAAVAMVLHGDSNAPELLMIQRAEYEGDPWSGHMAFPGGRLEAHDASLCDTAIRETQEELGVDLTLAAELITPLSPFRASSNRQQVNLVVQPFIFKAKQPLAFTPNREVGMIVSIPIAYLFDLQNRVDYHRRYDDKDYVFESYLFKQHRIWGMSLRFIDEMMAITTT